MYRSAAFALFVILAFCSPVDVQAARDPFKGTTTDGGAPSDVNRVLLLTPYGRIYMRLLSQNAPKAAAAVRAHAEKQSCRTCKFYRAEARPRQDKNEPEQGPPYALLQGSLDLPSKPEHEGNMMVKAGHVAFIPGTSDFFIALNDHDEWGTSHTVFAEIEDWVSTDLIAAQFYHEEKHPEYGTVMRMMNEPVPFQITTQFDLWVMQK